MTFPARVNYREGRPGLQVELKKNTKGFPLTGFTTASSGWGGTAELTHSLSVIYRIFAIESLFFMPS